MNRTASAALADSFVNDCLGVLADYSDEELCAIVHERQRIAPESRGGWSAWMIREYLDVWRGKHPDSYAAAAPPEAKEKT